MSRSPCVALPGYAQLAIYSFHLDYVLCDAAIQSGAREQVLLNPVRMYHSERAIGFGWTQEGPEALNKRPGTISIPRMSNDQLEAWAVRAHCERTQIVINDGQSGLTDQDLPETSIYGFGERR